MSSPFKGDFNDLKTVGIYNWVYHDNWETSHHPVERFGMLQVIKNYNDIIHIGVDTSGKLISRYFIEGYNRWTDWRETENIIAKSLNITGYITYASGLILQWGSLRSFDSGDGTNTWLSKPLPILFSNGSYCIVATNANNIIGEVRVAPRTQNTYSVSRSSTNLTYYSYFAISH